jgi:hypothetical protein
MEMTNEMLELGIWRFDLLCYEVQSNVIPEETHIHSHLCEILT